MNINSGPSLWFWTGAKLRSDVGKWNSQTLTIPEEGKWQQWIQLGKTKPCCVCLDLLRGPVTLPRTTTAWAVFESSGITNKSAVALSANRPLQQGLSQWKTRSMFVSEGNSRSGPGWKHSAGGKESLSWKGEPLSWSSSHVQWVTSVFFSLTPSGPDWCNLRTRPHQPLRDEY